MPQKLVAYLRVSTAKQGRSGLGLEAQKAAVEEYAAREGGTIVATYTEVESGRKKNRPELDRALAHTQLCKGKLVVARLDRLSRSVSLLAGLMEAKVDLAFCDLPTVDKFVVHVLAAAAEHEAELASKRTKAGLAIARKKGKKLGSHREGHWKDREARRRLGAKRGAEAAAKKHRAAARSELRYVLPDVVEMRERGMTYQAIADALNAKGLPTRAGLPWTPTAVLRAARMAAAG